MSCPNCGRTVDRLILIKKYSTAETVTWCNEKEKRELIGHTPMLPKFMEYLCPACDGVIACSVEEAEDLMEDQIVEPETFLEERARLDERRRQLDERLTHVVMMREMFENLGIKQV